MQSQSKLDDSDFAYFRNVLQELENENIEDKEDKLIFLENVMKATKGKELALCYHPNLSWKVEKLLQEVQNSEHVATFIDALSKHFYEMSMHKNASSVLETLLGLFSSKLTVECNASEWVLKYSEFAKDHLEELLGDVYASHVLCTLFKTLSGCRVTKTMGKRKILKLTDKVANNPDRVEVPKKYSKSLDEIVEKLSKLDDLSAMVSKPYSNIVVQTAFMVLKNSDKDKAHELVNIVLKKIFNTGFKMTASLIDPQLSRLLEAVIGAASDDQFNALMQQHFVGNMRKIVTHKISNFIGQRLLQKCNSKDMLVKLFEELSPAWEEINEARHLGVLVALAEACSRLKCCQAKFINRLAKLLQCSETEEQRALLSEAILMWLPYEQLTKKTKSGTEVSCKVNYHGSLLIQNIFDFQKPIMIVDSLLSMSTSNLGKIACNSVGSHVFDAYFKSITVGGKKRLQMVNKLKGEFYTLSTDRFAARSLECIWKCVDTKTKQIIVQELCEHVSKLMNHPVGVVIAKLTAAELYKRSPKEWNGLIAKSEKMDKFAEEILADGKKSKMRKQN